MEFLSDPTIWIGLLTLVVLEIVLGIDNLVFIAILADKLPPHQRDKARLIGLSLALIMRLGLLTAISWMVTLTEPLFSVLGLEFSGRDLILLFGGLFLVFKATMELHERMEGKVKSTGKRQVYAGFWLVVSQIVVIDAVFSLDAVITAVGMVDELGVMVAAVTIAMIVMIVASKPLTRFVSEHPTVVILCLSFLLMIGFSLVAEGFGMNIPKGYLYAAIGFSILIETFNQVARRNFIRNESNLPIRDRTADAILRLMGTKFESDEPTSSDKEKVTDPSKNQAFVEEERLMISGVLTLAERSIRSVMTPRGDISWLDSQASAEILREQLLESPHSLFPVGKGSLENLIGVVRAKEVYTVLENGGTLEEIAAKSPPIVVPESASVIKILNILRGAKGNLVIVVDEFGIVQGLVTPLDILEVIAGDFPDADETPDVIQENGNWIVKGSADLHQLEQVLGQANLSDSDANFISLGGLLLSQLNELPKSGLTIKIHDFEFEVLEVVDRRIESVKIRRLPDSSAQ